MLDKALAISCQDWDLSPSDFLEFLLRLSSTGGLIQLRIRPRPLQTAVWLLRSVANEPLNVVVVWVGVSTSRIAKIQAGIESLPLTRE